MRIKLPGKALPLKALPIQARIKSFILKAAFFCMLFLGLFLTFSPWVKEALMKQEMTRYSPTSFTVEEIESNREQAAGNSEVSAVEEPDFAAVLANISKVDRKNVVGAIAIEELGLLLPVLEGTNTQNLLVGATTVNEGQVMGEGNYVLAGHHMNEESLLFGPLLEIKAGEWIQLTDLETVYTYEVVEKKLVKETDLSVLEPSESARVTLITCDVSRSTDNRLIIVGELLDSSSTEEENEYVTSYKRLVRTAKAEEKQYALYYRYAFYYWNIGIGLLALGILVFFLHLNKRCR